jgi:hypothetical protein
MGTRPILRQELLFGHDAVAMLDKVEEDGKYFGLYRHQFPSSTQLVTCGIELIRAKAIDHAPLPCVACIRRTVILKRLLPRVHRYLQLVSALCSPLVYGDTEASSLILSSFDFIFALTMGYTSPYRPDDVCCEMVLLSRL